MLQDTPGILIQGFYSFHGETLKLKLSHAQTEEARVFLPQDVRNVCDAKDFEHFRLPGRCEYGCENVDSFTLARKRTAQFSHALMIHPQVEIIRDEHGNPLPETVIAAVMTCAAPMICYGEPGTIRNLGL